MLVGLEDMKPSSYEEEKVLGNVYLLESESRDFTTKLAEV